MCTAMTMQIPQGDTYFGRTMDFSYPLDPSLYFIPKGCKWNNILHTHIIHNQYNVMGIGQDISPVVLSDGVNEMGFGAAALYFPGFAKYDPIVPQDSFRLSIAAVELVKFLLSQCASVTEAATLLPKIRIVGVKDAVTNSVAPLHWIIADKHGSCMTIEKTEDGLHLMNNPIGVLSNSPDFQWHMTNLRNYMNVTPSQHEESEWDRVLLTPFGQGAGTMGLPGDYTPPARFVKTAYQKTHSSFPADKEGSIITCFHIMDGVSIPKGVVMTSRGEADYTQYTAFINLSTNEYFFKTYDNSEIVAVTLPPNHGSQIVCLGKLTRPVAFHYLESMERNQTGSIH